MMPRKNTAAIEASTSAVFALFESPTGRYRTTCPLPDHRWGLEAVIRRRRRQVCPLERVGAVPRVRRRLLSPTEDGALQDDPEKDELRQTEAERADRGNEVVIGKLQRIVRDPARHPRETEEMHREESDVEENHASPEMPLAELFVVHAAGPLRQPEVDPRENREQRSGDEHVVEVR